MTLTPEQKEICNKRLIEHQHKDYFIDINFNPNFTLNNLFVMKGVFRPETTSGFYLAKFLANNLKIFLKKKVLDLGCGSGIQGITCALNGASQVVFSDISELAVKNAKINTQSYNLLDKTSFNCGNLFKNITEKFDIIIFNHPFFDSLPLKEEPITRAWFDDGELLKRFLKEAPNFLNKEGLIIMSFFPFAGKTNNPKVQGQKYNYQIEKIHEENINDQNLQKGLFQIFSLKVSPLIK
jgi:methylase of polypeptide subunit release factors